MAQTGSHHSKSTDEMPQWKCTKKDEDGKPKCDGSGQYPEIVKGIVRVMECDCLFEKEMALKIWRTIPAEYRNLGWEDFIGLEDCDKSTFLAGKAKDFFLEKTKVPKGDSKNISAFFGSGINVAIIGKSGSGVTMLSYLLLKEAALNGFYIDRMRWSNFVAKMRGVIFSKDTEDQWAENVSFLCAPDVLFIDNVCNQKISNLSDSISFLTDVLEARHEEKKTTIFGMDFIPNEQIFGPAFYNAVIQGRRCLRIFLSPAEKLIEIHRARSNYPPESLDGLVPIKLPPSTS